MSVLIRGMQDVNRALDGDVVAIEILPKQQWLTGQEEVREGGREGGRQGGEKGNSNGLFFFLSLTLRSWCFSHGRPLLIILLLFTHTHVLGVSRMPIS